MPSDVQHLIESQNSQIVNKKREDSGQTVAVHAPFESSLIRDSLRYVLGKIENKL